MGPGHSSILRIGSSSTKASGSSRQVVSPIVQPWLSTGLPQGNLLLLWAKARAKLVKSVILGALNI